MILIGLFCSWSEIPTFIMNLNEWLMTTKVFPKYQLVFINNISHFFLNYYSEYTYLHFTCGHKYQGYLQVYIQYIHMFTGGIHKACVVSHLIKAHKIHYRKKIWKLLQRLCLLSVLGEESFTNVKMKSPLKKYAWYNISLVVRIHSCWITSSVTYDMVHKLNPYQKIWNECDLVCHQARWSHSIPLMFSTVEVGRKVNTHTHFFFFAFPFSESMWSSTD